MYRDWHIIAESKQQIGVGFPDDLGELIEVKRMDGGHWIYLSVREITVLHCLVESELCKRGILAEQERIEAEAEQALTQEAIDRMDDDSLTARCALEAARRGWIE